MIQFSVIIPTYNRPRQLAACLDSLTRLQFEADAWELILVNDGGKTSFSAITDALRTRLPLTLLEIEHGGPARARNAGAAIARGEFLVFTDDDCQVDPNWLLAYQRCFASSPYAALGGKTLNPYPESIPAEAWSRYMDYLQEEILRDREGNLLLLIGNNLAYRREIFQMIGGFDERFPYAAAEDSELGNRLVGSGYQQGTCPAAIIWHDHKNTAGGYVRQQFRYGRGQHHFLHIVNEPDYPAVERQDSSFVESIRKLLSFANRIAAPLPMKLLFVATPFAFKAGTIYEGFRSLLQQSAFSLSSTKDRSAAVKCPDRKNEPGQ